MGVFHVARVVKAVGPQRVRHVVELHPRALTDLARGLSHFDVHAVELHRRVLRQPEGADADAVFRAEVKDVVQGRQVLLEVGYAAGEVELVELDHTLLQLRLAHLAVVVYLGLVEIGPCAEFAAALSYLFNQNGIPAQVASGTAGDSEHFWVIAELGGKAYHFDPTFENSATGGLGLSYFGMSDAARTYTGCALPCTVGRGGYAESLDAPCPDTRFDEFFTDVTSWDCDVQTHFLYLAYGFEEDYLNSVQTDTLLDGAE